MMKSHASLLWISALLAMLPIVFWLHYCVCVYYPVEGSVSGSLASRLAPLSQDKVLLGTTHIIDLKTKTIDICWDRQTRANTQFLTTSSGLVVSWEYDLEHPIKTDIGNALALVVRYHDPATKQVSASYTLPVVGILVNRGDELVAAKNGLAEFVSFGPDGPAIERYALPETTPNMTGTTNLLSSTTAISRTQILADIAVDEHSVRPRIYSHYLELLELRDGEWTTITWWPIRNGSYKVLTGGLIASIRANETTVEYRDFHGVLVRSANLDTIGNLNIFRAQDDYFRADIYDDNGRYEGQRYFDVGTGSPLADPDVTSPLLYRDEASGYRVFGRGSEVKVIDSKTLKTIRTISVPVFANSHVSGGFLLAEHLVYPTRKFCYCKLPEGELEALDFSRRAQAFLELVS